MIKIIGWFFAGLFTYFGMYLSAAGTRGPMMGYVDTVSFFIVLGISYFGTVAAHGKFLLDLKGLKFINKLLIPCAFLGVFMNLVMMLYATGGPEENMASRLGLSLAVASLSLLYACIFKIIFSIIIESKEY